MAEPTLEALQHFMIESGCKVKSSDAIEFFRLNYAGKVSDVGHNKDLFKLYMEQLTRAEIAESGERYLVLKRQHMMTASPQPYRSFLSSPRPLRSGRFNSVSTSPRSPRTSVHESAAPRSLDPLRTCAASAPSTLLTGHILSVPQLMVPHLFRSNSIDSSESEDGLRSPASGYDSEELDSEDQFDTMELGSVGGCSNNQLEPTQKEWIYKAAVGDIDSVSRLLLQDRALVKYKDFISGYTGLHWACKLGRLDMAHVLVASDSDINSRAYNGMTPLHIASQSGHEEVIDFLLKEKADKLIRDYNGKYPVHYLSKRSNERIRDALSPPLPATSKPRQQPVSTDKPVNFSLRRHKREKSDISERDRTRTLNNNFKYQPLVSKGTGTIGKCHKRPLSGIKIDHTTVTDGNRGGATPVRFKEEALESVCSNSTLSPKSVKRISLGTPFSALYDTEPLLNHQYTDPTDPAAISHYVKLNTSGNRLHMLNNTGWSELKEEGDGSGKGREEAGKRRSRLLCCCPRRKRGSSL